MDGLSELLGKPHGRPVNVDLAGYYRWRRMWIDSDFQQKRSWFGKMLRGSDHDTALPEPNSAPTKLQDFRSGHYLINRNGLIDESGIHPNDHKGPESETVGRVTMPFTGIFRNFREGPDAVRHG
jgi:hypothetical protein